MGRLVKMTQTEIWTAGGALTGFLSALGLDVMQLVASAVAGAIFGCLFGSVVDWLLAWWKALGER